MAAGKVRGRGPATQVRRSATAASFTGSWEIGSWKTQTSPRCGPTGQAIRALERRQHPLRGVEDLASLLPAERWEPGGAPAAAEGPHGLAPCDDRAPAPLGPPPPHRPPTHPAHRTPPH